MGAIIVRKDLTSTNVKEISGATPSPGAKTGSRAVKRLGATPSPIPVKKSSPVVNIIGTKKTSSARSASVGPLVANPIPIRRTPSSGKKNIVQNVSEQCQNNGNTVVHNVAEQSQTSQVDCITIED